VLDEVVASADAITLSASGHRRTATNGSPHERPEIRLNSRVTMAAALPLQ